VVEGFPGSGRMGDGVAAWLGGIPAGVRGRLDVWGRALLAGMRARWSRRMLLPALGAAATVLAALVVVVSLVGGGSSGDGTVQPASAPSSQERSSGGAAEPLPPGATLPPAPPPDDRLAPGRARRVERQASLVLAVPAREVGDVADAVVRVTDEVGGIVVTSSVSGGERDTGATFSLRVPTRRVDEALARLSRLGQVRSRTQGSRDVTGAFVAAQERLAAARAERKSLLRQLARADTPNETASIRARLRIVQAEIAAARAEVRRLRTRTAYSAVSVAVEGARDAGGGAGSGARWTPGDALGAAGRVLEVTVSVALVSLAVIGPFALLGAGALFAARLVRHRRRERALETG
jgi:hypothetical protein